MYIGLPCEVPVILIGLKKLNFLNIFSKNPKIKNLIKFPPVGTDFFPFRWTHRRADGETDGQTDMTKLMLFVIIGTRL